MNQRDPLATAIIGAAIAVAVAGLALSLPVLPVTAGLLCLAWTLTHAGLSARLWLVLLAVIPILRIGVGPAPVYAIDVVLAGVVLGLALHGHLRHSWRSLPARVRVLLAGYA